MQLDDLTSEELAAIRAYKADEEKDGQSLCSSLNQALRNGLRADELQPTLVPILRGLDSVFRRVPRTTSSLTVYRGTGTIAGMSLHEGDFRTLQFFSTADNEEPTGRFLRDGGALLILTLPVGTPVYNMEALPEFGGLERELLLPRGIRWSVIRTDPLQGDDVPEFARFWGISRLVRTELTALPWREPLDQLL